jgi:Asp-tRNA(Asn)/Glu-tRNA(Gln) amidotransferase A subunit family amidase
VISHEDYDTARGIVSKARKAAGRLFERVDAILTPAAPGAPPLGLSSTGRALFNRLWTLTGDPAVAVPGLMDDAGLPLGMQIIAPFGEDHKALAIAHWLEGLLAKE